MNGTSKAAFLLAGAAAGAVYMFGMPAVEHAVAGGLRPPAPACATRGVGNISLADIREAVAYVRAHPVPHRHGMIAGIVTADYCAGRDWAQILVTPKKGALPTIWCGTDLSTGKSYGPCSVPDFNDIGAYEYAPRSGGVRRPSDIQVITPHAVPVSVAEGA